MKGLKLPSKTIIAIIAIVILEALAILQHIDGAALSVAIATIAGLGGYQAGKTKKPKS